MDGSFAILIVCPFCVQAGTTLTPSSFSQYKGELVISLKYVTETQAAGEKPRGEGTVPLLRGGSSTQVPYSCKRSFLKKICIQAKVLKYKILKRNRIQKIIMN